jgi:hypothetical protein
MYLKLRTRYVWFPRPKPIHVGSLIVSHSSIFLHFYVGRLALR